MNSLVHQPVTERSEANSQTQGSPYQRYLCPAEHGSFVACQDTSNSQWLVSREPEQRPWTMAAEKPFCLFCGATLVAVNALDELPESPLVVNHV
jgi:hypothetical protein